MHDTFEPLQQVRLNNFTFNPKRYEIWASGKKIKEGQSAGSFSFDPTPLEASIQISYDSNNIKDEILSFFVFDVCYTLKDRILLAIIAKQSNIDDYNNYATFKATAPIITREQKTFKENEPYVGSIFYLKGKVDKITFSIGSPGKLIEFYSS